MTTKVSALVRRAFLMLIACGLSALTAHAQFNISLTSPLTLHTQQYGPVTVTLTSANDLWSGNVVLTCSTPAPYSSCIFPKEEQSFAVSPSGSTIATVYINTSEIYKYQSKVQTTRMENVALCSLFAPAMCWLFLGGKRRKKAAGMVLFVLALLPLAGLTGCTSMTPPSTPPGTYFVNFVGTSGGYVAAAQLTLVVTP